ncbi:MAG: hypothetical protein ACRDZ1_08240 [Acidimicrobiia bacterium]
MHAISRVAWFAGGAALLLVALDSAVRTFVLPRGAVVPYTRAVFAGVRGLFDLRVRWARSYEARDRVMALYAPLALLVLPATWLVLVMVGYTGMFRALGVQTWRAAFQTSGSSLFTLGFVVPPETLPTTTLAFTEAAIGLGLIALLIAYLPTIYNAFSRREATVATLAVQAGTPPSAVDLLIRAHAIERLDQLDDLWLTWQSWFAELEETHTSLAVLVFFRSPQPDRSWVTAAGAVLDSAAFVSSTVDVPWAPQAGLCVRAGFVALRTIGDFFGVPYDPDPAPTDPISIARDEFDQACDTLASAGVPLKPDREQAWRDFAGWRVNYDTVLLALAALTAAPYAPWSSDRSFRSRVSPIRRRRR